MEVRGGGGGGGCWALDHGLFPLMPVMPWRDWELVSEHQADLPSSGLSQGCREPDAWVYAAGVGAEAASHSG